MENILRTRYAARHLCHSYLIVLCAALLTACAPRLPAPAPTAQVPVDFPEAYYRQAQLQGRKVLRVDPDRSIVAIEVQRAGTLARLGHNHVVSSHHVQGYVASREERADLYIALNRLAVDEPGLRAEAGFDTQPSADAVEGTRRNMLNKVLEAQRFPFVLIHATRAHTASPALQVAITLHGATRTFDVPAQIETDKDSITVTGRMALNQTDFGIVPFSVLGGALQVRDRIDLRFRIVASDA